MLTIKRRPGQSIVIGGKALLTLQAVERHPLTAVLTIHSVDGPENT
jgi:hypothetical protein